MLLKIREKGKITGVTVSLQDEEYIHRSTYERQDEARRVETRLNQAKRSQIRSEGTTQGREQRWGMRGGLLLVLSLYKIYRETWWRGPSLWHVYSTSEQARQLGDVVDFSNFSTRQFLAST